VQPNFEHQTALVRHHLQLAAELNRPVSMHCVRCYGFLEQLFRYRVSVVHRSEKATLP
jgi:TatD DNase family protein